jgi:PAS domain S-box-containing protein
LAEAVEASPRRQLTWRGDELQQVLDAAGVGVWDWDVRTGALAWTESLEPLHGLEPGTFDGTLESFLSAIHPDDLPAVQEAIGRALDGGAGFRTEFRVASLDGRTRWVAGLGRVHRDADGQAERLLGVGLDITERKEAEESERRARREAERAAAQLVERTREAGLGADVGAALTAPAPLERQLQRCAEAMVSNLDAAFARIWALNDVTQVLELRASAGMYTHLDGPHGRVPVGKFKIGLIAEERQPHLTNEVVGDPRVGDQEWAQREGMIAFAGYPLMVDDRVLGVMAMFSRHALGDDTLRALASVADEVAIGIERARVETERNELLRRLDAERSRLHDVFQAAPAMIGVLRGPDHVFELANEPFRKLIGGRDFIGKPLLEAFPEAANQPTTQLLRQVYASGEPFIGNEVPSQVDRDGDGVPEEAYFNFVYQPTRDADGEVDGIFIHAVDVTEQVVARRRVEQQAAEIAALNAGLEQRVAERTAELEASNKELESFCYSVSHDLRAPLRSIDGFSIALLEDYADKLDEEGQDNLQRIRANSQRMGQLIDDLLNLSRLTRQEMSREPVDLSAMAERLLAELRERDPGRAVTVAVEPGLSADADPRLMQVALGNLLSNAWKFTSRRAGASIQFGANSGNGPTVFYVRDNGAGFDMAYVDKLFGAFQRLHAATEFEGTGIGLATVQRVVRRHGGRVWADAAPDQGATFYFTLEPEKSA